MDRKSEIGSRRGVTGAAAALADKKLAETWKYAEWRHGSNQDGDSSRQVLRIALLIPAMDGHAPLGDGILRQIIGNFNNGPLLTASLSRSYRIAR
ncbi:hypothetical protein XH88_18625 [Bradyrhizobium sp. CCBAU 51627]|nr:hypothetical protein [Bradyrhizobium sp. CCBAU 51627]